MTVNSWSSFCREVRLLGAQATENLQGSCFRSFAIDASVLLITARLKVPSCQAGRP